MVVRFLDHRRFVGRINTLPGFCTAAARSRLIDAVAQTAAGRLMLA
jgi:hypothetical protein